jgi:hypothetical protein
LDKIQISSNEFFFLQVIEMTPLSSNHPHVQNMSSHAPATNVYPIMQQTYQSQQQQQPVPMACSTAVTPRHQNVVAQLQQLQMQQQQQQPQQQLDYYNVSSQQQQQPKQQQQRRRQVSRDSSRWSLLDEDDGGDRDDCGDQVQFNEM